MRSSIKQQRMPPEPSSPVATLWSANIAFGHLSGIPELIIESWILGGFQVEKVRGIDRVDRD
jgi:hypothetical protein